MEKNKDFKSKYYKKLKSNFEDKIILVNKNYKKKEDLRYGTNPHQKASLYKSEIKEGAFDYNIIKEGKEGMSQTNYEDMHYAIEILKYYTNPAVVIMKHGNPSGVSKSKKEDSLVKTYLKARQSDPQAAFGGFVGINTKIDSNCAKEIMQTVIEGVVASSFSKEALEILKDWKRFKKNKHIRLIEIKNISSLPKYQSDKATPEIKMLLNGSVILSDKYLTKIKTKQDLITAFTINKNNKKIICTTKASQKEYEDLLFAWYINISTRSNAVVIAKNQSTLSISTGQQDRISSVEQAINKAKKYGFSLKGSVLSSDGFFPFSDSIELIAKSKITAVIQPGGSIKDEQVIKACNNHKISMFFTDERAFSHH